MVGNVGEVKERCGGRCEKVCWGEGEGVGSLLGSAGMTWGKYRNMWGVGRSVGRGEGNMGKYGEALENLWEVCQSVLECGGGLGGVGKHLEVCLGCGEKCGKCVGVGRGEEKCGQKWRSRKCEKVWREVRCGGCW